MSIYNITYSIISNLLNVPSKRLPKFKAWLAVLLKPLQWLQDLFANDYIFGSLYSSFNALTIYQPGDRISFTDNRNYEFIFENPSSLANLPPDLYPAYWLVIQENFIGANDRVKFNSQIIMLEWELNVWYRNPLPADQIYLGINTDNENFWLGQTGEYSSKMSNSGSFATVWLANINTVANYDFTVYVPAALFLTLGTNTANREKNVRRFVDKYKLAGIRYDVQTY